MVIPRVEKNVSCHHPIGNSHSSLSPLPRRRGAQILSGYDMSRTGRLTSCVMLIGLVRPKKVF